MARGFIWAGGILPTAFCGPSPLRMVPEDSIYFLDAWSNHSPWAPWSLSSEAEHATPGLAYSRNNLPTVVSYGLARVSVATAPRSHVRPGTANVAAYEQPQPRRAGYSTLHFGNIAGFSQDGVAAHQEHRVTQSWVHGDLFPLWVQNQWSSRRTPVTQRIGKDSASAYIHERAVPEFGGGRESGWVASEGWFQPLSSPDQQEPLT